MLVKAPVEEKPELLNSLRSARRAAANLVAELDLTIAKIVRTTEPVITPSSTAQSDEVCAECGLFLPKVEFREFDGRSICERCYQLQYVGQT